MTETNDRLNAAPPEEAAKLLSRCCGSSRWVAGMLERRPFASRADLHAAAGEVWSRLGRDDFLEAFAHHPRIGDAPSEGHAAGDWSREEQSVAARGAPGVLTGLRLANAAYEARFGFVFLVCATGKTAPEIIDLLESRMRNEADAELRVAAAEQAKITLLRLDKLGGAPLRGPITSHVLDTSSGRPAKGLRVRLDRSDAAGAWTTLAHAATDDDGRIADLLQGGRLEAGTYRATFDTGAYFAAANLAAFYPQVDVVFRVTDAAEHHHVPLLLAPFGYSTYRGS
ncbi:MAG TPA: 2-oxo-4-hydroxy-4-carboxy-5-ureidoimidazoline decarboxylase [Polyangiaceae bacterium]|jgi:hydroxyisourate hydrolase